MGEIADLLQRHRSLLSEADLAEAVEHLLSGAPESTVSLTRADQVFLENYSGARLATDDEVARLADRRLVAVSAEVAQSLTRTQVATALNLDRSRVSHRLSEGKIYGFRVNPTRVLFPDWQFTSNGVLPNLSSVLAAIDPAAPPPVIRRFMLETSPELVMDGDHLSPRDWLLSGADPGTVVRVAETLGDER